MITIAKQELNLHVENQYVGHDENRTANQIYLVDPQLKYQKRNFQTVDLSVLLSWLLESMSLLRNAATVECLPGKRS